MRRYSQSLPAMLFTFLNLALVTCSTHVAAHSSSSGNRDPDLVLCTQQALGEPCHEKSRMQAQHTWMCDTKCQQAVVSTGGMHNSMSRAE